jgi:methylated-DNA-[protein]-cysteine S-methyltransferase
MTDLVTRRMPSPIGELTLVASADALVSIDFPKPNLVPSDARPVKRHPVLDHAARELGEYFAGKRLEFTVPLAPEGTPFQRLVWDAL